MPALLSRTFHLPTHGTITERRVRVCLRSHMLEFSTAASGTPAHLVRVSMATAVPFGVIAPGRPVIAEFRWVRFSTRLYGGVY